jgi:serine/threonine protein kinase
MEINLENVQSSTGKYGNEILKKYRILKKIGKGTFSTVFLCEDKNQTEYAMKVHFYNPSLKEEVITVV